MKEQVDNKITTTDKRTCNAPFAMIPTSLLTIQTLARLKFQRGKEINFLWRSKENFQFR